jgi:hypothetical protein
VRVDNEQTQKKKKVGLTDCNYRPQYLMVANLLYQAICTVLYRRTAVAIKMASLLSTFFCCCFVCCCPGGRWGNMEQVVARWQHPVASEVALDMPHQAMPSVLLRHTAVAIKTASG